MKAKMLLCMMLLGLLTATAQPPRVLENNVFLTPSSQHVTVNQTKPTSKAVNGMSTTQPVKRTKALAGEQTYQVDLVLDFDTETQNGYGFRLINAESEMSNYDFDIYQLEKGSNVISVPAGTYDIILVFMEISTKMNLGFDWPLYFRYVVREQVTIDQNMTLNFAASEAKNHIHFETLTIDGEPVNTGAMTSDGNWNWTVVDSGNTDNVMCYSFMFCKEFQWYDLTVTDFGRAADEPGYYNDGYGLLSDFFVNDVSDRYAFYCYRVAVKGMDAYTSDYEVVGASNDVTVTNDPSEFILFEDPFIAPKHQGEELYRVFRYTASTDGYGYNQQLTSENPLAEGETIKCYVSASPDNNSIGMIPVIQSGVATDDYGDNMVLFSPPLVKTNGQLVLANEEALVYRLEYSEELNEWGQDCKEYPYWPKHPVFTTSIDKKTDNLGDNCPVLAARSDHYRMGYFWEDEDGNLVSEIYPYWEFIFAYCGRYNETKPDDVTDAKVSVKLDGEEIVTGQGSFQVIMDQPLNGVVDATITNEMVEVDGLSGSNKAQLHYTAGAEDQNPPTVTMLQFKDADNNVTDRLATADEGRLELSAGDFNVVLTPMDMAVYDRYAPESVEVSYSPYGEDNWDELAVEEVPENYWPTMGWFYTAPLAGVTGEGLNGWFDLKIRLTDAAGNWQEQVISPAFRLDDHAFSSVATLHDNNAHEVARYNLAGQRVNSDATGVVIIKMSDGTARKVIL